MEGPSLSCPAIFGSHQHSPSLHSYQERCINHLKIKKCKVFLQVFPHCSFKCWCFFHSMQEIYFLIPVVCGNRVGAQQHCQYSLAAWGVVQRHRQLAFTSPADGKSGRMICFSWEVNQPVKQAELMDIESQQAPAFFDSKEPV